MPEPLPADARAASRAVIRQSPGYRSSLGISRRGEPRRESRRRSHRRESGYRCPGPLWGHRGARPRVGVRSRGQRPTSRRGGYRGDNHNDPDTTAAVTHGPGPKFTHGRRVQREEASSVSAPLCSLTAGRGEPASRRRGVAGRAPLTMGSVSEGGERRRNRRALPEQTGGSRHAGSDVPNPGAGTANQ